MLAHELHNVGLDEFAADAVADDGITAIARAGVSGFDLADRRKDRFAGFRGSDVARQHAVACAKYAEVCDAVDYLADPGRPKYLAFPGAIARVVRELHGVDRPDLAAEPLQGEHRGGIAHVPIGDVGLDRDEVHVEVYVARMARNVMRGRFLFSPRLRGGQGGFLSASTVPGTYPAPALPKTGKREDATTAFPASAPPARRTCWYRSW